MKSSATALILLFAVTGCAHRADVASESSDGAPRAPAGAGFDAELTGYEYPYEVHFHPLESQRQQLRMAFMDVHPETPNGRTVVLLHGKNFSGAHWAETIALLRDRGYRVVVPDQIGFGKSSKPAHYQFTFQTLAENTAGLLDALGIERVAVVGHSMGGMLATRFALMFPRRVSGLALVNPIGLEDWKRVVPYRTVDEHFQSELKTTPESIRAYMRESYFAGEWKPEYEALVEMLAGWSIGPDRERIAWNAALTSDMAFTQPVVHEFGDLRVPTLLIIGVRDRTALGKGWAPEDVKATLGNYDVLGEKAAAAIPGAKLVELEGIGHIPQVEAFEAYSGALLAFLDPLGR